MEDEFERAIGSGRGSEVYIRALCVEEKSDGWIAGIVLEVVEEGSSSSNRNIFREIYQA